MKRIKIKNKKGLFFLIPGLLLILLFVLIKVHQSFLRQRFSQNWSQSETIRSRPVKVEIPSLGLDSEVVEGQIVDGIWEVAPNNPTHLKSSANPGEPGNIIIYGHNQKNIFGPIRWLKKGDKIRLINQDNEIFNYQIEEILIVKPDQIEYLLNQKNETLILYTCTGLLDSQRHLVIAQPVE